MDHLKTVNDVILLFISFMQNLYKYLYFEFYKFFSVEQLNEQYFLNVPF